MATSLCQLQMLPCLRVFKTDVSGGHVLYHSSCGLRKVPQAGGLRDRCLESICRHRDDYNSIVACGSLSISGKVRKPTADRFLPSERTRSERRQAQSAVSGSSHTIERHL